MAKRKAPKSKPKPKPTHVASAPVADSADDPYPHQTRLFLALISVSIVLRLGLLITSRHYLRSDEAVTAMEVLDIIDGGPIPFFHYGQSYGGGHTVEALMALPWFVIFGPADYFLKLGPAMLAWVHILVVYLTLYKFFSKKFALIAVTVFSFFSTFVAFNFSANGGMVTLLFGWLGLHFFFHSYFADKDRHLSLFLSGVAIGFAYYCFDYALYYLLAVIMLWILKENIHLWRRWKSFLFLMSGFLIGASPLVYYNLTHDFANIKNLLSITGDREASLLTSSLENLAVLFYHDLPAFFSLDIYDFAPDISPISYFSYILFLLALLCILIMMARPIASLIHSFFKRRVTILASKERIIYIPLLMLLYFAIYSLSSAAGKAARYLIPLCPLIPILIAWPAYHLGRQYVIPTVILFSLFGIGQIYFLGQLAKDKTTVEWQIATHGEDIKTLARFLLDNNLTTVMTPYEIKWKLMFESQRKVVAAAYMFGFDREHKYNMEVIDRVNRRGIPLTVVFDKEYKLPQIALRFNPEGAFDLAGFHEFLRQNQITYQITPVGRDYIVYHDFSQHFLLPDPYRVSETRTP